MMETERKRLTGNVEEFVTYWSWEEVKVEEIGLGDGEREVGEGDVEDSHQRIETTVDEKMVYISRRNIVSNICDRRARISRRLPYWANSR